MENFLPTNSLQGSTLDQSELISISGFSIEDNLRESNNNPVGFQEEHKLTVEGLVLSTFEINNSSHGAQFSGLMAVRELLDC